MARLASMRTLSPFGGKQSLGVLIVSLALATSAIAQQTDVPGPQTCTISGTVTDVDGAIVPGATVTLTGPAANDTRTVVADSNAAFDFTNLSPGGPYQVTIKANGLIPWTSPAINLNPGQAMFLPDVRVRLSGGLTSVTVYGSSEQLAVHQVSLEEKQRVLGIVPNFYVSYDKNPAPLTTKLKFQLAWKAETDPVVIIGAAFLSGMDQAGDTPDYDQGAAGYAKRFGANYTTGMADIMIGGAILPSLLHQDPRYFYQGTGTTRSRLVHALAAPFICKGDNGRWQFNYSSIGGDLAAGAISEAYLPVTNRGAGLVFQSTLITTAGRMTNGVIQEFLLRRLTPGARNPEE